MSTCSLHISDVCVRMRDVIFKFNSEIEGSLAFCALMFCDLLYVLCVFGSSLHVECILPLGCCVYLWGE